MGPARRSDGDVSGVGGDARADVLLYVSSVAAADMGGGGVFCVARRLSGGGDDGEEALD